MVGFSTDRVEELPAFDFRFRLYSLQRWIVLLARETKAEHFLDSISFWVNIKMHLVLSQTWAEHISSFTPFFFIESHLFACNLAMIPWSGNKILNSGQTFKILVTVLVRDFLLFLFIFIFVFDFGYLSPLFLCVLVCVCVKCAIFVTNRTSAP